MRREGDSMAILIENLCFNEKPIPKQKSFFLPSNPLLNKYQNPKNQSIKNIPTFPPSSQKEKVQVEEKSTTKDTIQEALLKSKGKKKVLIEVNEQESQNINDDEGWTLVTRRKHNGQKIKRTQSKNIHPFIKEKINVLAGQNKCFRCLSLGHIKRECREPRKCFKCGKVGHNFIRCFTKNAGGISSKTKSHVHSLHSFVQHKRTFAQVLQESPSNTASSSFSISKSTAQTTASPQQMAAPHNWPAMPLPNNDPLLDTRIPMLRWYRPPGAPLRSENQFLTRSIFITVSNHQYNAPAMATRILRYAARRVGRELNDFTIAQVEEDFGDFILVCPTNYIRDVLVQDSPIYLDATTMLQMEPYQPGFNMVYAPTAFRAIIQLTGAPLNLWNRPDLRSLVSGFCYPISIEPHFINGNFNSMRMLIACHHPTNIPRYLHGNDPPFGQVIQVNLLGYIRVRRDDDNGDHGLPPPPPPPNQPPPPPYQVHAAQNEASNQGSRVTGSPQDESSSRNLHRLAPSSHSHTSGQIRQIWRPKAMQPVRQEWRPKSVQPVRQEWRPKVVQSRLQSHEISIPQHINSLMATEDLGSQITVLSSLPHTNDLLMTKSNEIMGSQFPLFSRKIVINALSIPMVTCFNVAALRLIILGTGLWESNMSFVLSRNVSGIIKSNQEGGNLVQFKSVFGDGPFKAFQDYRFRLIQKENDQLQAPIVNGPLLEMSDKNEATGDIWAFEKTKEWAALGFIKTTPTISFSEREMITSLVGDSAKDTPTDKEQAAEKGKKIASQNIMLPRRKSERLQKKDKGIYIPVLHRAQQVQKGEITTARKTRKKVSAKTPQDPEYLSQNTPLTEAQCQVILLSAGIDYSEEKVAMQFGDLVGQSVDASLSD